MYKIVFIRHGESLWNRENRFTGWTDVDLSEKGLQEASSAGKLLKQEGFTFDIAFTSVLKRAIRTLNIILDEMDLMWLPVNKSWRLNERHYGAFQGLNKSEMAEKIGEEQVLIFRRSFDVPPPALEMTDERFPGNDPRYNALPKEDLPLTECLKDTIERAIPFWNNEIVPQIKSGKNIIVAAHGNSLRAIVKHLDNIPNDEIVSLNIPTGIPLVYELNEDLTPIKHYYLGDQDAINAAMHAVASQGKSQKSNVY